MGLRAAGAAAGGAYGGPAGASIGRAMGAGLSHLIGAGDYKVNSNSLINGQTPAFGNHGRMVRLQHREYLGDVTGSIAFAISRFPLNPGIVSTFPWLSCIASNYQTYRFRGLVFHYKSTSASALNNINSALGTVCAATQYNANAPDFVNKIEMENYMFSVSCKPAEDMLHPVECDARDLPIDHLYVRTGALPAGTDQRLYDMGEFQLATVGMQAASTIGELWVTYDVELWQPRLAVGGVCPGRFARSITGAYSNALPLGTAPSAFVGSLDVSLTGNNITLSPLLAGGRYLLTINWWGTAVAITVPGLSGTNVTFDSTYYFGGASSNVWIPGNGVVSGRVELNAVFRVDGYSAAGSVITLSGAGTLPSAGTNVEITIVCIPYNNTVY